MTIKVTRWSPDTCSCVLEYEWDDAQDESTRTHKFGKAVHLCEHHRALTMAEACDQVLSENTRKNIIFGWAKELKPDLELDDYTWSFEKDRKLKVGFLGKLNANNKSKLRALCNTKFGQGKIEVI